MHLDCKHKELELIYFSQDPPAADVISVKKMTLFLDEIAPGIELGSRKKVKGYRVLEQDILTNGMDFAIVVVPNNKQVLENGLAHLPKEYYTAFDPSKPWLCLFGNQRMSIAKENGYDTIEVYPMKDINRAIMLGKKIESGEF